MLAWAWKFANEIGENKGMEWVRLVTSSPSTDWWEISMKAKPMVCFTRRLRFIDENGRQIESAKFDSALMVVASRKRQEQFLRCFEPLLRGVVMGGDWKQYRRCS